ncbi:TIGR00270 family protein [Candidatus Woesearchaeota archaeon]|nr:TIGR00270 family protein [Candidatus Woesearchaeota archaeon]
MANCDTCGKNTEKLYVCEIEGTQLNVCKNCTKYGKIIKKPIPKIKKKKKFKKPKKRIIQTIIDDFPNLIKNKREKLGLKQKELAIKLAERESIIQKLETGQLKPSLKLARKLESHLDIELVVQKSVDTEFGQKSKSSGKLTIGDMIRLKK